MKKSAVTPNFESLLPQISAIRHAFRTPSISLGVLHHGEVIFRHSEGLADVGAGLAADADTVYAVASCTKPFVTAAIAGLVAEGKLDWDAPVSRYLPDFAHTPHDPEVGRRATLRDACSHGTGLAPLDHAVMGFYDEWYITGKDQTRVAANLPVAYDLRSRFLYNNTIIGIAGEVLAAATGLSAGRALKERIFDPLGLRSTFTSTAEYPPNAAKGYTTLDDGTLVERGYPVIDDGMPSAASGFVRSSVNDMLAWAAAVMEAEAEAATGTGAGAGAGRHHPAAARVLRGIEETRAAHRPITIENSGGENAYGLGWFRHMLPTRWLGSIGPIHNGGLLRDDELPVINADGPARLTLSAWGEFQGFLAAFYTLPVTGSAVVVLANSGMSRGDPTDLIAQLLLQELFDMRPRVRLDDIARRAAAAADRVWPSLVRNWELGRTVGTSPGPLADYVGTFRNRGLLLTIDVFELGADGSNDDDNDNDNDARELLGFRVNGLERQTARLRHYHHDVWTFMPRSRDDAVIKGLELYLKLEYLLLSFQRRSGGGGNRPVDALEWDLQGGGDCEGPAPGLAERVKPIRFERV